jgi:hypothetical protein
MYRHISGDDVPIIYIRKFREFGLKIIDGGTSFQKIAYCPWCGRKLPESLRSKWFCRIEEMGLEPDDQTLPESMRSDAWWKSE